MTKDKISYLCVFTNSAGLTYIGYTNNVEKRRQQLQTASGLTVTHIYSDAAAPLLHNVFNILQKHQFNNGWSRSCTAQQAIDAIKYAKQTRQQQVEDALKLEKARRRQLKKAKKQASHTLTAMELEEHKKLILEQILDYVGGVQHLARMLDVHYMVVQGWKDRGQVSKGGAAKIEEHETLGKIYKAKDIRPDF